MSDNIVVYLIGVVGGGGCSGLGREITVRLESVRKTGCLKQYGRSRVLKYGKRDWKTVLRE